jgi:hypothetical protein
MRKQDLLPPDFHYQLVKNRRISCFDDKKLQAQYELAEKEYIRSLLPVLNTHICSLDSLEAKSLLVPKLCSSCERPDEEPLHFD